MKKISIWIAVFALLLSGCFGGNVSRVNRVIGESQLYGGGEIRMAMEKVIALFDREFDGCTLLEIEYNEEFSEDRGEGWARQYGADEAIVLISSFYVDASGGDGSLNPNSTYRNYQWILTRKSGSGWQLQTWGYG